MNSQSRGEKRKRQSEGTVNSKKGDGRTPLASSSLASKLHHAPQLLTRAAKKARTFEVQKLVRKLKSDKPKSNGKTASKSSLEELPAILSALKDLDLDVFSLSVLHNRLSRDKSGLADKGEVQAFLAEKKEKLAGDESEPASAQGKARNKILASKTFQEEMKLVVEGLKAKAGLSGAAKKGNKEVQQTTQKETSKEDKSSENTTARDQIDLQAALAKLEKGKARQRDEDLDSDATSDSSDEDLDSDDDDDGSVSHISADEDEVHAAGQEFSGIATGGGSDDGSDEEEQEEDSASIASSSSFPAALPQSKSKKEEDLSKVARVPATMSHITSSAFLPSLAAGYTLGDENGSVYYDSDEDGAGSAKPQRKNRRGQRARQAIWERKYGKSARHVVKNEALHSATEANRARAKAEKEIEALRKSGRYVPENVDANLTALTNQRKWATSGVGEVKGPTVEEILAKEREKKEAEWRKKKELEAKPIHSSWEASKKKKEMEMAVLQQAPQGKKIKF